MSPSWRARSASPRISQVKGVLEAVEPGDAAIVDAEGGELHVRPTQEVVSAYADKVRFRARRQAQYAALRNVPSVTLDGARVSLQHQCRPRVRPAASRSVGRRRHRPVPHRAAIHDLVDLPAARAADPASTRRSSTPRATGRWCSARSTSAATRCCPTSARAKEENPAHRLARHPHGARPAGAVPHPDQGAAQGGARARAQDHAADDRRCVGAHGRARADRPRGHDPQAARPARAEEADGRGHDRGAGAALAARSPCCRWPISPRSARTT